MRIAIAQYPASPAAEVGQSTDAVARAASAGADLVLLPEPAAPVSSADPVDESIERALRQGAREHGIAVVAGLWQRDRGEDRVRNRVVVIDRDGATHASYDKLHLYDAFGSRESDVYRAGAQPPPVVDLPGLGLRLGVMTCYDVRFPEVARDLAVRGAQVLAVPAAWAAGPLKEEHWQVLLRARAVENTAYVAAAGRTPPNHIGRSMVVDPAGVVLADLGEAPGVTVAEAASSRLDRVRRALPLLDQRRYADPALQ